MQHPDVKPQQSKLIPCPDCDQFISRKALACPQCGRPMRSNTVWILARIALVVTILYLGLAVIPLVGYLLTVRK